VDELTELVRTVRATQNQPPPPPPVRTQAESGPSTIFGGTTPLSTTQQTILEGRPWGVPISLDEIFHPIAREPPVPTFQPTIHTPPQVPTRHPSEPLVPTFQHTIYVPPPVATRPQATVTYSTPAVHTVPQNEECNTPFPKMT